MITVEPFNKEKHASEILQWYREWDMQTDERFFDAPGFIVPKLAALFVMPTGTKIACIECMVSKRNADRSQVFEAFLAIQREIEKFAKVRGIEKLIGFSANPATLAISERGGYQISNTPSLLMVKELAV